MPRGDNDRRIVGYVDPATDDALRLEAQASSSSVSNVVRIILERWARRHEPARSATPGTHCDRCGAGPGGQAGAAHAGCGGTWRPDVELAVPAPAGTCPRCRTRDAVIDTERGAVLVCAECAWEVDGMQDETTPEHPA